MVFANLIVLQQAAEDSITGNIQPKIDVASIAILCTGTAIKAEGKPGVSQSIRVVTLSPALLREIFLVVCFTLIIGSVLFIICRSRNTTASRILAIDQRNDCFTNLVALAGAFIGHRYWKYADPIGAAIVRTTLQFPLNNRALFSSLIIVTWLMTVKEQVPLLIGKSASPQLINRIINVAISHDERIKYLDTVYVYHFGANFLVELHVVMDREINLCEAHDVSETLQGKLEQLSFVERAFVHCDYKFDGDEHV
ncbi:unnamed protein product [Haemonchus placei]|uniref:ZT_dimer domain-containing protein n=1 Tax=Haemonchus placei TaxID=6290 RepID=A0A0N4X379_HAEPC|nr:unnamed protein product [Haemonchus placei]